MKWPWNEDPHTHAFYTVAMKVVEKDVTYSGQLIPYTHFKKTCSCGIGLEDRRPGFWSMEDLKRFDF